MTIQEEIHELIRLQEIDTKLLEIHEKKTELEEEIQKVREPLSRMENERDDLNQKVEELSKEVRALEQNVPDQEERIRKSREKLPQITTQKEYFAVLKEIETMERDKENLEESLLKKMGTLEELQSERDRLTAQCREEEKTFQEKRDRMIEEHSHYDTETEKLNTEKENISREIDPQYLAHYQKVLNYKGSPAVVKIIDGNCQGCFMTLPPQLFNDVRKGGHIITCSYCNRILYAEK